MVQGSVGFHCPACTQAHPQRQPRLRARRVQPNQVTSLVLIAVNVVVWLAILVTGQGGSPLIETLALIPEGLCPHSATEILLTDAAGCAASGHSWLPGVATGAVWQVLTSAFVHVQPWHILFNMFALHVLGPQVEGVFGRARFLTMYGVSALAASALVMAVAAPYQATLGASGAIFGLMGAFLVLALRRRADLRGILVWLGLNAAITLLVPNVSWAGHLGGFLGGVAVTALMVWGPTRRRGVQWALVGALAVALLVATAGITFVRFG